MAALVAGKRDKTRLTLDFTQGSYNAITQRIHELNAQRGKKDRVKTFNSIGRSLLYAYVDGHVRLPESTVRLCIDVPVGSYARFKEKLHQANEAIPSKTGFPNRPTRFTAERVVRTLMGSWMENTHRTDPWAV